MTELPILYSFRRCPYAMRARMALLASETVCELREVLLAHKPAELVETSPKATVPVLLLPDDTVLEESFEIMLWALRRNDRQGWLAGDSDKALALIETNDGPFKHHLDRYKYSSRYDCDPIEHRAAGIAILAALDQRLVLHPQLTGDRISLADIAIFPFVRQFAGTDRPWFDAQPLPGLQKWLDDHLGSDLFSATMVRHPRWETGTAPVRFPMPEPDEQPATTVS